MFRRPAALLALLTAVATAAPAQAQPTGAIALTAPRITHSQALRSALHNARLHLNGPVFRNHPSWAIYEVTGPQGNLQRLDHINGVRWTEPDTTLPTRSPATRDTTPPQDTLTSPPLPTSTRPHTAAALPANPCTTTCPAPPTGCSGTGGLDAGLPNDPIFCGENVVPTLSRPFYAEEWDNFCFIPDTQPTTQAGAPQAPQASGMCSQGAWKLGAQGEGTIVAIVDSGVNYLHDDLKDAMVTTGNDPLLADPKFPGAIHGWNFYDDNPDPMDFFGHGTGRAGIAAARGDNGVGLAGVAPRALIMAVKVGDTYVVHSENLAQGVVYAADHGADVINTSLGATGNSRLLRLAATYADSKGVVWAAATANEYSTHHNYPTNLDTVMGVGGLGPDALVDQGAVCNSTAADGTPSNCAPATPQTTWLQKVNYANYGGIQTLAAPIDTPGTSGVNADGTHRDSGYSFHQSGTSTSTPHVAGAAAVVRSAGFLAGFCQGHPDVDGALTGASCTGPALSSNEVRQLLIYTATRVHNDDGATADYPPASNGDPTFTGGGPYYPEQGGDAHTAWNIWSGYGRPDLYAASAYAEKGLIPPEAQLYGDQPPPGFPANAHGPVPFAVLDPTRQSTLDIVGHVAAPRLGAGQGFAWKVQVAPCLEPGDGDWRDVGSGTAAKDGVLATWSLPTQPAACSHQSANQEHPFSPAGTYTVRVLAQVTQAGGGGFADPVAATDPNYPAAPDPAPLIGQDRRVVYVRHDPTAHGRSPYYLGSSGEASPTLYDLEGRGELDTIEPTADGRVLALRPDGTQVPGWPVSTDDLSSLGSGLHIEPVGGTIPTAQIIGSVAVGDIDADGQPEVVAASAKGGIYAWHRNGTRVAGFPVAIPPAPTGTAAANPKNTTDKDGHCTTRHEPTAGLRYLDYGAISAPVLANLDGSADGKLDIVQAASACVYAVSPAGKLEWSIYPSDPATDPNTRPAKIAATPAVGDLDHDGHLDVVVGTEEVEGGIPNGTGRIYAYDGVTHALKPGWPVKPASVAPAGVPTVATGVVSSPALYPAGDGTLRVVDGVFLSGSDPQHAVQTYKPDGSPDQTLDTQTPAAGSNFTDPPFLWAIAQVAIGAVGDAPKAIVTGGLSTKLTADTAVAPGKKPQFQHVLGAWNSADGAPLPTFPRQIEDWQFLAGPAIADVKGDGTHQVLEGSGGGYLHAFDPAGAAGARANLSTSLSRYQDNAEPAGFPIFTGGYITSTPAVGQLTRGGPVTVATVTRDGYLFLNGTKGRPTANDQWWHFHHDERNTGLYGVDTRPPATATDLTAFTGRQPGTAGVRWTETGDDWWVGRAARVQVRWSVRPITDRGFASAHAVPTTAPGPAGRTDRAQATALPRGTRVYFAERAVDDAGNTGLIARASVRTRARARSGCGRDRLRPLVRILRRGTLLTRHRAAVHGTARDVACVMRVGRRRIERRGSVRRVQVAISVHSGRRCRFLRARVRRLGRLAGCRRGRIWLTARGTTRWAYVRRGLKLPKGRYDIALRATDAARNTSRPRIVRGRVR